MDYNKLWSLINKEKLSKRAAARIAGMSQTGFNSMMDNETMSVSTLEIMAKHFKKDVSYFFEEDKLDEVEDPNSNYYTCRKCSEKDGMIKLLEKQTKEKDKTIIEQSKIIGNLEEKLNNSSKGKDLSSAAS